MSVKEIQTNREESLTHQCQDGPAGPLGHLVLTATDASDGHDPGSIRAPSVRQAPPRADGLCRDEDPADHRPQLRRSPPPLHTAGASAGGKVCGSLNPLGSGAVRPGAGLAGWSREERCEAAGE